MTRPLALLLLATTPLLGACASTAADAPAPAAGLTYDGREVFGDFERLQFGKSLQVRLPAKVAVYDASWSADDERARRVVQAVRGLAADTDTYTDVVSLAAPDAARGDFAEALRAQAAGHQADLLLVLERRPELRESSSPLALLNILILPAFVLPTQFDDVSLTVRAIVQDVRNGLVYTTFDDHRRREVSATAVGEDAAVRETDDALFEESVAALREALARKLPALERASR